VIREQCGTLSRLNKSHISWCLMDYLASASVRRHPSCSIPTKTPGTDASVAQLVGSPSSPRRILVHVPLTVPSSRAFLLYLKWSVICRSIWRRAFIVDSHRCFISEVVGCLWLLCWMTLSFCRSQIRWADSLTMIRKSLLAPALQSSLSAWVSPSALGKVIWRHPRIRPSETCGHADPRFSHRVRAISHISRCPGYSHFVRMWLRDSSSPRCVQLHSALSSQPGMFFHHPPTLKESCVDLHRNCWCFGSMELSFVRRHSASSVGILPDVSSTACLANSRFKAVFFRRGYFFNFSAFNARYASDLVSALSLIPWGFIPNFSTLFILSGLSLAQPFFACSSAPSFPFSPE
jgi:hypothetical protein